jgi:triacylglycerol lipase
MATSLNASASGDAQNALFLSRACELAYLSEAEGSPRFRSELGLEAKLISVENTQVYVAQSDDALVVAFRGSEAPNTLDGLKDWLLTNANNYLILPEGQSGTDFAAAGVGARFHRGFLDALAMVWQPLFAAVDQAQKAKERPLWVTGHSLGGAIALLAAWRFQRNFLGVHEIVTFGGPMIGNDAAAKAFEQEFSGKIYRFVDLEDVVPHLPSVSLLANAYKHCLNEVVMTAPKVAMAAAAGLKSLIPVAESPVGQSADADMNEHVWQMVQARIASHMINNYQARIEAKCKDQV